MVKTFSLQMGSVDMLELQVLGFAVSGTKNVDFFILLHSSMFAIYASSLGFPFFSNFVM